MHVTLSHYSLYNARQTIGAMLYFFFFFSINLSNLARFQKPRMLTMELLHKNNSKAHEVYVQLFSGPCAISQRKINLNQQTSVTQF